jgi:DNA-directed RNA polymerase subunit RPC12/RpoP
VWALEKISAPPLVIRPLADAPSLFSAYPYRLAMSIHLELRVWPRPGASWAPHTLIRILGYPGVHHVAWAAPPLRSSARPGGSRNVASNRMWISKTAILQAAGADSNPRGGGRRCLDVPLTGYTARLNSDREQAAWVLDILEAYRRLAQEAGVDPCRDICIPQPSYRIPPCRPHVVPVLAASPVLRALLDLKVVSRHSVAVTAAAAARAIVVHAQLDVTEGTFALDYESDRVLRLLAQRLTQAVMPTGSTAPQDSPGGGTRCPACRSRVARRARPSRWPRPRRASGTSAPARRRTCGARARAA